MKSQKALAERLKKSNIILVSHAMNEVARLCNVVVLVQDGRAVLFEDVKAGIQAYQEMNKAPQVNPAQKAA
jgi:capsular polysaccharide transport system ATP-binding protein